MGNMATGNAACNRIAALCDAGSFVEIGGAVTARATDFNLQEKDTPAEFGVCIQSGCFRIKWSDWRDACKEDCEYL